VDLFDGGARSAAIQRARAVIDELTESDRKGLLAIARDVETAYLRLGEARARYGVAAQAVGAADESLQLVAVQYRGGAATVTRYLEAESGQARARTAKIQAQLDVERATVDVERAIGRLSRWGRRAGDEG
jgi:outer membrane protein